MKQHINFWPGPENIFWSRAHLWLGCYYLLIRSFIEVISIEENIKFFRAWFSKTTLKRKSHEVFCLYFNVKIFYIFSRILKKNKLILISLMNFSGAWYVTNFYENVIWKFSFLSIIKFSSFKKANKVSI